ncbi:hybrid sensor histidine kinase/response regulator, partial [Mesorhizobium sp. M7A.F.Ca.US.007.01.1.1]
MAAVRVVRRLREAGDWQREMDGILETLCRAMDCQRGILFRLRELPGQGFAQSVAAYWIDPLFGGELASPTVIMQSIVNSDPLLERLAEDERQGKIFAGHT